MDYIFDLRHLIPPLISFIHNILLSQDKSWAQYAILQAATSVQPVSVVFNLFLIGVVLLFLFISLKLPLTMRPIRLGVGDFSRPFTLSLAASIILPPSSFWLIFPILVITYSWYPVLLGLLMRFMYWLCHTPQAILERIIVYANGTELDRPM